MSQEANLKMLRFNDWRSGESGTFQDRGPANSFYGVNMQVYNNGSLGIRPGFKVAVENEKPFAVDDNFLGACWVPADRTVYVDGLVVWVWWDDSTSREYFVTYDPNAGTEEAEYHNSQSTAPLSGPKSYLADFQMDHELACFDVLMHGNQMFQPTAPNGGTALSFPASFNPGRAVFYRDRVYYFRPSAKSARVYYSNAGDPETITTGAYFDLGTTDNAYVQGAYPLKNGLVFYVTGASPRGYGEWWVMTGSSPRTGTLRRFARGPVPRHEFHVALHDEKLYFYADDTDNICVVDGATVDMRSLGHLYPGAASQALSEGNVDARQAHSLKKADALIMPYSVAATPTTVEARPPFWQGMQSLEMVNGAWTRHLWFNGDDPGDGMEHYHVLSVLNFDHDKVGAIVCAIDFDNYLATFAEVNFVSRDVCLDRPGKATDEWSSNKDERGFGTDEDVVGEVHMREIRSEDGRPFTVRRVEVDVDYWADDGTLFGPCGMDLDIGYAGSAPDYGVSEAHTTDDTVEWTNTTESLADSTNRSGKRITFAKNVVEARPSQSAELHLTNIRNLAIREVRVWIKYETSPVAL